MLLSDLTHNETHHHIYCDHVWYQTKSDSALFANSRGNNSDSSGPIKSIISLIRDLMVTYILTNFDWMLNARV